MSDTVDFRGLEQVGTFEEVQQLAAFEGYSKFYYGKSRKPHEVDLKACLELKENRLLVVDDKESLLTLMNSTPSCDLGVVAAKIGAGILRYIEESNLDETRYLVKRWELLRELENWDTDSNDPLTNFKLIRFKIKSSLQ